jgi:hypothetical protein
VPKKPKTPKTLKEHLKGIAKRGGNARMQALSEAERQELATKAGKSGGKARAKSLSAEERSRIARKAALEMWRKRRLGESDVDR